MLISFFTKHEAGIILGLNIKTILMISTYTSEVTKKLAFRFILENIDYRKKCLYVQEIISLGKENDAWRQALALFFDCTVNSFSLKAFSKN
jgi:hypothetical protein